MRSPAFASGSVTRYGADLSPYISVHNFSSKFRRSSKARQSDMLAFVRSEIGFRQLTMRFAGGGKPNLELGLDKALVG